MSGNRFPLTQTPEERAEFVAARFETCADIAPYVRKLRCDFRALKPTQTIMGCRTWTEFCKKVLRRTTRAVRYTMVGGNPRSKRKPANEESNWQHHWDGMPEFEQPDHRAFKSIMVHFDNQDDLERFATLTEQKITLKTRYIWYPFKQKNCYTDIPTYPRVLILQGSLQCSRIGSSVV
jgi:hypothetical protein